METEPIPGYKDEAQNGILPVLPLTSVPQKQPAKSSSAKDRKKLADRRTLRPGQAGIAWERLKRVVRDHCNHPAHEQFACHIYGGVIEFHCSSEGPAVALIREEEQILLCVNGTQETIRIVGLKTKGVGFEWRRHRYTATRVIIEILYDARMISERLASLDETAALTKQDGRQQRRTTETTTRKRITEA